MKRFALGIIKRREPGTMNGTERAYSQHLTMREQLGEVLWFAFESITLKLAKGTSYTPDFAVMMRDGTMEMHEVKGHWLTTSRVKIKVAAEKFPFVFRAFQTRAKKDGGGWSEERFGE